MILAAKLRLLLRGGDGRALLFSALSLLVWLSWSGMREVRHPWADLSGGAFTDHFSHMNAARAFTRIGLEIYRTGPMLKYPPVSGAALQQLPADVRSGGSWTGGIYAMPGSTWDKPWVTSWAAYPRPYPPGDLLLFAPIAYLYDQTELSFTDANRLLLALLLVYTHVGVFFATRSVLRIASLQTPVLWISWLLLYLEAIHHTLEGFYDFAAAAPLIVCFELLYARRAIAGLLAFCIAAFIHFRALFLAPLSIYAALLFVRQGAFRTLRRADWLALTAIVVLSGAVLGTFWMVTPALRVMNVTNFANAWVQPVTAPAVLWLISVVAIAAALCLYLRAYFDFAVVLWLGAMYLTLREAQPWHSLIVGAWLIAPAFTVRGGGEELLRSVRLFLLSYVAIFVLRNPLWPNFWVPSLWAS